MAADEIERLRVALKRIADYPQGQVFSAGFAPDDAEAMQEIAKVAIANEQPAQRDDGSLDDTRNPNVPRRLRGWIEKGD